MKPPKPEPPPLIPAGQGWLSPAFQHVYAAGEEGLDLFRATVPAESAARAERESGGSDRT